jgi:hypothetical protein
MSSLPTPDAELPLVVVGSDSTAAASSFEELRVLASYDAVHGLVDVMNMLYALALALVLLVAGRRAELDIGLWFGWQGLLCVFVAAQYPLLTRAAVYVRELNRRADPAASRSHFAFSPAWLAGAQSRAGAQVLISVGFLGADVTYAILRAITIANDCGAGTSCSAHYSIHLLVTIVAGAMAFLACGLLWAVARVIYWVAARPYPAMLPSTSRTLAPGTRLAGAPLAGLVQRKSAFNL